MGEVGEGDLQGNSPIDTGFVLQVMVSRDCGWMTRFSYAARIGPEIAKDDTSSQCIVATTMNN